MAKYTDETAQAVVRLRDTEGKTWNQIAAELRVKKESCRSLYKRARRHTDIPQATIVSGVRAAAEVDEDEVMSRALAEWEKAKATEDARNSQVIRFDKGPVAVTFLADQHIGGHGVNYPRLFDEAELVAATPGMFAMTVGDLWDNFIIGKLVAVRMGTHLDITDEIVLGRRYLEILAPRLLAAVSGNHENWTRLLSGIDYFRDVLSQIKSDCLYDRHDLRVTIDVEGREFAGRLRHKWRGHSIYNPTHAVERSLKFDERFDWGVAAHTHTAGVTREFSIAGKTGIAALCGCYKEIDPYSRRMGFPIANENAAVTIIFSKDGMFGTSNLNLAANYMRTMYQPDCVNQRD